MSTCTTYAEWNKRLNKMAKKSSMRSKRNHAAGKAYDSTIAELKKQIDQHEALHKAETPVERAKTKKPKTDTGTAKTAGRKAQ